MSYYSEILDLNREDLIILSDAYFGYAAGLVKNDDSKYYPYIASCYVVSGVLKSIINPGSGADSFKQASHFYRLEENNYWIICSICAYDIDSLLYFYKNENDRLKDQLNELDILLLSAFVPNFQEREIEPVGNSAPVGRLNIPIRIYRDAFQNLQEIKAYQYEEGNSLERMRIFFNRSAEYLRLLKEDTFHWQQLRGNFLPVEPEIIAFSLALCQRIKNHNINLSTFVERFDLDPLTKLPLQLAIDILNSEEGRQEGNFVHIRF